MGLAPLVAEYQKELARRVAGEDAFFRDMPSMELAIHHVALAIDADGRCFDHQWRIQQVARRKAKLLLLSATPRIKACGSFDELHTLLHDVLSDVHGLGEMYVYDAAQRLGAYLGLSPTRVYLHRGVRDGAKALGLDVSRGVLEIRELPKALQMLPASELENFLCIYRKRF